MVEMEKQMHRFFANFIHNSNPNDSSGVDYPSTSEPENEMISWQSFIDSAGLMRFGYNVQTPSDETKPTLFEENFKKSQCDFWNSLDVYANH